MDLPILEIALRRRQCELWLKIVKTFEVEQSLNIQVQNWIREGKLQKKRTQNHDILICKKRTKIVTT